jgi:replication initiation protein RepC
MDIDNSAHGAPWRGFAHTHTPTGFRRLTPALLKADRSAEGFAGLPEGVESPRQLLAAFKAAAPRLGVSPRLVHAVDWLFCFTQPQDWEEGARPIVWPSAQMQQEALGLGPSQAKEINNHLIELGLVTMKDSPNGKRYGRRHEQTGRILEAYGFDLSPIAARHAEFVRLAKEAKAERAAIGRLRRRSTIARKAIVQILETAQEYGFDGEEWSTLNYESNDLVRALRAVESPEEMEAGVESLERWQQAARERLEHLLETVETGPKEPENRPHIYNYKPALDLQEDTVITTNTCSGKAETRVSQSSTPVQPKRPDKGMVHGIAPDELVQLAPKLKPYLRCPDPTWPELVDAADWLRGDLGVSKSLWGEACLAMGRELAAVALAIVSTKEAEHFKTSPGGYFHGLVAKHVAGELYLERTVWALRRAIDPERYAGRERSSRVGQSTVAAATTAQPKNLFPDGQNAHLRGHRALHHPWPSH